MAIRKIYDDSGKHVVAEYNLKAYVWRNKPVRSPLTGAPVRCVVAQNADGTYRGATRIGEGVYCGKRIAGSTIFDSGGYQTKEEAIEYARLGARCVLEGHIRRLADRPSQAGPGEVIARVEMDDGWSYELRAPEGRQLKSPPPRQAPRMRR